MKEILTLRDGIFYKSGKYITSSKTGDVYEIDGKRYRVGEQMITPSENEQFRLVAKSSGDERLATKEENY